MVERSKEAFNGQTGRVAVPWAQAFEIVEDGSSRKHIGVVRSEGTISMTPPTLSKWPNNTSAFLQCPFRGVNLRHG